MSSNVVLVVDPEVLRIPIKECGEPLVDLRHTSAERIVLDDRKRDREGLWLHVRQDVTRRLKRATDDLPDGLALLFIEGY